MTKDDAIAILQGVAKYLMSGNEIMYSDKLMIAIDMAIEALEAQKMKYTFGNDGFSLENAYHDCKLVFDGITDDRSYQEADTGLILYYANEIIYALHKALKEVKNQNQELNNSNDLISRQAALDEAEEWIEAVYCEHTEQRERDAIKHVINGIKKLPSAQPVDKDINVSCKDAISRQAVINALNSGHVEEDGIHFWRAERNETIDAAVEIIQALPPAQPEPEHTMEEFMYGQELGDPEDGSL